MKYRSLINLNGLAKPKLYYNFQLSSGNKEIFTVVFYIRKVLSYQIFPPKKT